MDTQRSPHTKVFIQRDYSDGTAVKFQTRFPPELEGRVDRATYERTINTLNEMFAEAESLGSRTYCESCFACLTAYLALLCMDTYYEKSIKKVRRYLEDQNQAIYMSRGVMIIDPAERGLRIDQPKVYEFNGRGQSWVTSDIKKSHVFLQPGIVSMGKNFTQISQRCHWYNMKRYEVDYDFKNKLERPFTQFQLCLIRNRH